MTSLSPELNQPSTELGTDQRDEGHIDPDIFALLLRSGVYLDYARQFLQPEQVDAVAIDDYLGTACAEPCPAGGAGG
ncbi:hypothetical protein OL229_00860 [Neisseriaceae bacterium JH1-16]|nr:hypothetical protein [Neisseriaceae bacterium JH1-16]